MSRRYARHTVPTIHRLPSTGIDARSTIRARRYAEPVAIFGRNTARRRLRKAARESLAIPAFGSAVDCTPWVTDGLWPAELSTITPENATVARYLRADLERIARSANEELRSIRRAGIVGPTLQAEESRVVDTARGVAAARVAAALRQLGNKLQDLPTQYLPPVAAEPTDGPSHDDTQQLPIITAPLADQPPYESYRSSRRATASFPQTATDPSTAEEAESGEPESDHDRLQRLVEFMARQEPGLRWAAGDRENRSTVVATDIAHGWIPPGIAVPADVRLLPPQRRTGNAAELLGPTTVSVTYAPGDHLGWSFGWATEFDPTASSLKPRRLPPVDDLGWLLCGATHWREGLPHLVHTLAKAGAARTGILEPEIGELREHLDAARLQLLAQYPSVDHALLLNCLLLAATEGIARGDRLTANYHFAWYQTLNTAPVSRRSGPTPKP